MKLTAAGIAKIAAAVATALTSGASGAYLAHQSHGEQLSALVQKLDSMAYDIRLLKCAADFPGDCPGQAKAASRAR